MPHKQEICEEIHTRTCKRNFWVESTKIQMALAVAHLWKILIKFQVLLELLKIKSKAYIFYVLSLLPQKTSVSWAPDNWTDSTSFFGLGCSRGTNFCIQRKWHGTDEKIFFVLNIMEREYISHNKLTEMLSFLYFIVLVHSNFGISSER
jgi:hypothetical protein